MFEKYERSPNSLFLALFNNFSTLIYHSEKSRLAFDRIIHQLEKAIFVLRHQNLRILSQLEVRARRIEVF